MSEKLTWNEIVDKYPNQWVGIVDAVLEEYDNFSIKSGIVKYSGLRHIELMKHMLDSCGKLLVRHTNSN